MSRQYILVDRISHPSRRNHSVTCWRMVFYSLDDGLLYEMTTDSSYRNFRASGWDWITEDDQPWGVYEGLTRTTRTTQEGMPIITADSRPSLIWRAQDRDQALKLVEADQNSRNPTDFERIFDHAR